MLEIITLLCYFCCWLRYWCFSALSESPPPYYYYYYYLLSPFAWYLQL